MHIIYYLHIISDAVDCLYVFVFLKRFIMISFHHLNILTCLTFLLVAFVSAWRNRLHC